MEPLAWSFLSTTCRPHFSSLSPAPLSPRTHAHNMNSGAMHPMQLPSKPMHRRQGTGHCQRTGKMLLIWVMPGSMQKSCTRAAHTSHHTTHHHQAQEAAAWATPSWAATPDFFVPAVRGSSCWLQQPAPHGPPYHTPLHPSAVCLHAGASKQTLEHRCRCRHCCCRWLRT